MYVLLEFVVVLYSTHKRLRLLGCHDEGFEKVFVYVIPLSSDGT
jgi:hypothetical protein